MVGFPLRLSNHYRHRHDLHHTIFAPTTSIGTKHVGSDLFSADIVILGEAIPCALTSFGRYPTSG